MKVIKAYKLDETVPDGAIFLSTFWGYKEYCQEYCSRPTVKKVVLHYFLVEIKESK